MSEGSISQSELDALFSLGSLEELSVEDSHVWIIKAKTGAVIGGRCFTFWDAQTLLAKAQKDYPNLKMEIKQIK